MSIKSKNLGRLSKVELREYWEDEARDFTPWLSEKENLELLAEAIGMELELVGKEQPVGTFKVDILAKDSTSNRYVIVENQLEKTNHGHLGQLITYASGFDAVAVVWLAKHICEEHRKALDWLNDRTSEQVGFFGIEVELWQIADSKPAPRFNIVSKPNDWSKAFRPSMAESVPTETKLMQLNFWENMVDYFKECPAFLLIGLLTRVFSG